MINDIKILLLESVSKVRYLGVRDSLEKSGHHKQNRYLNMHYIASMFFLNQNGHIFLSKFRHYSCSGCRSSNRVNILPDQVYLVLNRNCD